MRPYPQPITAVSPRVFNYSLDWRFLLPIENPQKAYFLYAEDSDFSQTLEHVGFHANQRLSRSDLLDRNPGRFDLFVMPFGLPRGWVGASRQDRVRFYSSIHRFIEPGGYLLVGFDNILKAVSNGQPGYYPSTPSRVVTELKKAGFNSVKIYGAMPDLAIPEYIFDIQPRAIQFALQNRFRRKPALLRSLRALARTVGYERLSNFLPSYFAVTAA